MAVRTGASLTAFTVRVNVFVSVRAPSVTTTLTVVVPNWLRAGFRDKLQLGAVPELEIFALGRSVVFDEVAEMELVQFGEESTSLNEYETEVDVSSFVLVFEIELRTGASLTAFTVRTKDFVFVSAPSDITTVIVVVPLRLRTGIRDKLQFGTVPSFVIFPLGTSVVLDEVTVVDVVQSGEESTSMNEYETDT